MFLAGVAVALSQDSPKRDVKDAGSATKQAAKNTGKATKSTAKKDWTDGKEGHE